VSSKRTFLDTCPTEAAALRLEGGRKLRTSTRGFVLRAGRGRARALFALGGKNTNKSSVRSLHALRTAPQRSPCRICETTVSDQVTRFGRDACWWVVLQGGDAATMMWVWNEGSWVRYWKEGGGSGDLCLLRRMARA
jgi:hypothetical protein